MKLRYHGQGQEMHFRVTPDSGIAIRITPIITSFILNGSDGLGGTRKDRPFISKILEKNEF